MILSIRTLTVVFASLMILFGAVSTRIFAMGKQPEVPRMTKEELRSKLGSPDVTIIDVRVGGEWQLSKEKIQGALREEPGEVKTWAGKFPKDKTLVLYCS